MRPTLFVKLRIMISMNLESGRDSEPVMPYYNSSAEKIIYKFIFHALTTWPTLFVKLWTQYVAKDHDLNKYRIWPRFE